MALREDTAGGDGSSRPDGDPGELRELSRWMRLGMTAGIAEAMAKVLTLTAELPKDRWTDDAGRAAGGLLERATNGMNEYLDTIWKAADAIDESAGHLASAQVAIDRMRQIVSDTGLVVRDGIVYSPDAERSADIGGAMAQNGARGHGSGITPEQHELIERRAQGHVQAYKEVAQLYRDARNHIVEGQTPLDQMVAFLKQKAPFASLDYVLIEHKEEISRQRDELRRLVGNRIGSAGKDLDDAKELLRYRMSRNLGIDAAESALRNLEDAESFADDLARVESGWYGRVIRFGGPGLLIVSFGFNIWTGEEAPRTIFASTAGFTAAVIAESILGWPAAATVALSIAVEMASEWLWDNWDAVHVIYFDER